MWINGNYVLKYIKGEYIIVEVFYILCFVSRSWYIIYCCYWVLWYMIFVNKIWNDGFSSFVIFGDILKLVMLIVEF